MTSSTNALIGKRVLAIGAGEGISWAIAQELAAAGPAGLAVMDLRGELESEVLEAITKSGAEKGVFIQGNVREAVDLTRAVETTVKEFGGLDVLVTGVGGYTAFTPWTSTADVSDEAWDLIFDLNLRYVFRLVRAAINQFNAQGTGGVIVSVGSIAGAISSPRAASYGAAKAGLVSLAKSVSAEYGRDNIRMNVVHPGMIATAALAPALTPDTASTIPAKRPGTPEDIARIVRFLASPEAAYIAGQEFCVDGGASVRFPIGGPGTDRSMAG
jgi:3-oxoacyl-[acyl-carrier protein] reductase